MSLAPYTELNNTQDEGGIMQNQTRSPHTVIINKNKIITDSKIKTFIGQMGSDESEHPQVTANKPSTLFSVSSSQSTSCSRSPEYDPNNVAHSSQLETCTARPDCVCRVFNTNTHTHTRSQTHLGLDAECRYEINVKFPKTGTYHAICARSA